MENKFKDILSKLEDKYNISFIEKLLKIENSELYLFGGALRDIAMGKEWKEADIRLVIPKSFQEIQTLTEESLSEIYIDEKVVLENLGIVVYRFLPKGSTTKSAIDLSVVHDLETNIPDFTINSLFYDLKNEKILDRYGALNDIGQKILRTCDDPQKQFIERPDTIFRAVKAAVSNNLTIDDTTLNALKKNVSGIKNILSFIKDNKKGLIVELFQSDIFRGLKHDPYKYFNLFEEWKIMDTFTDFLIENTTSDIKNPITNPFDTDTEYTFEEAISLFISTISKSISTDPENNFLEITGVLALDKKPTYTDFVIDDSKIHY